MTKTPRIAIVAPGEMGAAISARLVQNGAAVLTLLAGRSETSVQRANAAGMEDIALTEIAGVDLILSIVPPSEAVALAQQLAPVLSSATGKPVYVDCNAISPATAERVCAIVEATGARFVDAAS